MMEIDIDNLAMNYRAYLDLKPRLEIIAKELNNHRRQSDKVTVEMLTTEIMNDLKQRKLSSLLSLLGHVEKQTLRTYLRAAFQHARSRQVSDLKTNVSGAYKVLDTPLRMPGSIGIGFACGATVFYKCGPKAPVETQQMVQEQ